ncbi:LLM class flavin-dependent oxidoreductase [Acuticoccus mangrovi]|uniref:LLM class flavin-dependent oxidoreductase n=1 Tax=Acuticoccus mangrovi TaxID=2796142 RepID=A0A934ILN5_9HYPH|nr:LLM class flavin-dependent oxidoreductase [Acuticoccus mangrovi]MBJ3778879.1 LLM class flavin-dependent oxidoreductase [Acuticoccus mangrovi]
MSHPLSDRSRFNLGVFSANADGGLAITTVPERWRASWADNVAAARAAEDGGMDFFLPIARWAGFGGAMRTREHSFETFTWAAALGALTSRMAIFATVHVPLVHPLYAAKALATVDHVSGGRAGLNIVCGWNPAEFAMFGVTPDADGYDRADEWIDIIERAYAATEPFDYDGRFYRLKGVVSRPASLQSPRPVTMNAAFGDRGRTFAARHCDMLFTTFTEIAEAPAHVADIKARGTAVGRDIGVYTVCHVVCRPSQDEAEAAYYRYAVAEADHAAVAAHMEGKRRSARSHDDKAFDLYAQRFAGGAGSYPLVGTPEHIAAEIGRIAEAGYIGAALSFVNYTDELPFFTASVLPRLAEMGLR